MMGGRRGGLSGWQTMLADLALILFLVSASALDRQTTATPPPPAPPALPNQVAPAAIWREGAGAPPLAEWLAAEARDPRLQLTLLASPVNGARALDLAATLPDARVLVQATRDEQPAGITAVLAYDRVP